jgi:hypothetical protein
MFRALIVSALCWIALTTSASAQTADWGQVGGWKIRVDRTLGNGGCFAFQSYEDGSVIRLGFNPERKTIYFLLGNPSWKSLEVGKKYLIVFEFDGFDRYDGELTGITIGDSKSVVLDHNNVSVKFTEAFMQRSVMRVYYQNSRIASLSLANTYAAIGEVLNCQAEFNRSNGGLNVSDPFRSGGGTRTDPFSR